MTGFASAASTTLDALRRGDGGGSRELRLNGLGLREVPREIFTLADTLEVLDLGDNALTALPDDLGRLSRLRAIFISNNSFERLPPVLGDCPALSQIGARGCGLREVPTESLPPSLRWLTLTDNRLEELPAALGERPALQKLMLAGNRLAALPTTLAGAPGLELLRLSANRFETLPPWLTALPRLAWLAWAGNPLDATAVEPATTGVPWSALDLGAPLGQGASGEVYRALWRDGEHATPVALKLFKGVMTSDGLPGCEMAACLAAGAHANLAGGLGRLRDHPDGRDGLLMPLLPESWRPLASPPSLRSCSRDVYATEARFDSAVALRIAAGIAAGTAHLHARGLSHGDLYAHNVLWDGVRGEAVLSDFGAASFLPPAGAAAFERLDVRAWGLLLGELLDRCEPGPPSGRGLRDLQEACIAPSPRSRPSMREVLASLGALRTAR